jgi:hypothetical protein
MRKKLWTLFPLIGIAGIVAGCGGGTVSASSSSLDPAEKVAVKYIENSALQDNPQELKKLATSSIPVNKPSSYKITAGNVWVASVADGPKAEKVYLYVSPSMTTDTQLIELDLVQQDGKWLVDMPNLIDVPHLSFSDFQKSPEYQSIGITHWTEVKIG